AAVIRGRVLDRDGQPVSGVEVSVLGQPAYGKTLSRADGQYDLAVNAYAVGKMILDYKRNGYLQAQRLIGTRFNQFTQAEDVVLLQLDPKVTKVGLGTNVMQIARGSVVQDSSGQ